MQTSWSSCVQISVGCRSRSELWGSIWYVYIQFWNIRGPIVPHICQHLVLPNIEHVSIMVECGVSHGFNLHSLVNNGVYVFVCHLISSFVKCHLSSLLPIFLLCWLSFPYWFVESSFDIPSISSLSIFYIANIFSHLWLNSHLFLMIFVMNRQVLNFNIVNLSKVFLYS